MLRPWITQFDLEDSVGKTVHSKLLSRITADIQSGRLTPGSMLPGSRSLAEQLGLNRKTVQHVYEELEVQGWLEVKIRRGTFISKILPEQNLSDSDKKLIFSSKRTKPSSELVDSIYQDPVGLFDYASITNDGTPDARLIPYELLARTYRRICMNLSRQSKLGYSDPRGVVELRSSIQTMLSNDRFMKCVEEEICIVRGSQMGIYLASRILDPQKGAVVMENLCYPPAEAAFRSNGFEILKCKLDDKGLDVTHLEEILANNSVSAVYVTPHHQYPTTVCMPMDRRSVLLKLSKLHEFAVIEDDYDHEFHYETRPIPPLASLPNSENVIHIGSMSKVLAPGLRVGYIASDIEFIQKAAQEIVLIDRQGNPITEHVLSDLMESGEVKRHIRKVRKQYKERRDHAAKEFIRVFGNEVSFILPTGGLAIWIDISKLIDGTKLLDFANDDSILSTSFNKEQAIPSHLRFGFGSISLEEITQSIEKISRILNLLRKSQTKLGIDNTCE